MAASSKYSRPSSQAVARKKTIAPNPAKSRNGAAQMIDHDREQSRLAAFQHRKPQRQRDAGRISRVVHALDLLGDLVGEEAGDERRSPPA